MTTLETGWLRQALLPGTILLSAALLAAFAPALPPSLAGLRKAGPYAVLLPAILVALWFNRGRAFVVTASLAAAYAGYQAVLEARLGELAITAGYTAIAVAVPLNIAGALLLAERGALTRRSLAWLALIGVEALAVGALVNWAAAQPAAAQALLEHWTLRSPPVPFAGRLAFALACAATLWRAWPERTPLQVALASVPIGFFIALWWHEAPGLFGALLAACGTIALLGVLQESHRMAFRDELSGLPGRRALDERMRALGGRYTIAMCDVDHFKKFNDTHGHDIGDQVLKLVAARLAQVGGGGKAFRYGGEEFTVLFDDKSLHDALPHLNSVREAVERYQMAVRGDDRPQDEKEGTKRRNGESHADKLLSVTISIGAAEPARGGAMTPADVIKAADEALYRAKAGGRNRVSQ